jgi:subtilase family serine protease
MTFSNGPLPCLTPPTLQLSTRSLTACLNVTSTPTWARVRTSHFLFWSLYLTTNLGYVLRSDTEFKKLATRGITIIIADGDAGAGDLGDPPMSVPSCMKALNPDWPSQSPVCLLDSLFPKTVVLIFSF